MTDRGPLTRRDAAARRTARRRSERHPGWIRIGIALVVLAGVALGSTAYSVSRFEEAKQERVAVSESDDVLVDSIYSDRIEGQYDPDYDRARYRQITASFDDDAIHVDEYLAFEMVDADLDAIRDEVEGLEVPIYVAFVASSDIDDADGDLDLTAARIATELDDEKATVLAFGSLGAGVAHKGVVRDVERPDLGVINEPYSTTGLSWVRALKQAEIHHDGGMLGSYADENGDPIIVNERPDDRPRDLEYGTGSAIAGASFGLLIGLIVTGTGAAVITVVRHHRTGGPDAPQTTNRKG